MQRIPGEGVWLECQILQLQSALSAWESAGLHDVSAESHVMESMQGLMQVITVRRCREMHGAVAGGTSSICQTLPPSSASRRKEAADSGGAATSMASGAAAPESRRAVALSAKGPGREAAAQTRHRVTPMSRNIVSSQRAVAGAGQRRSSARTPAPVADVSTAASAIALSEGSQRYATHSSRRGGGKIVPIPAVVFRRAPASIRKPCPHGKVRSRCCKCQLCPHGRFRYSCRLCVPCPHGRLRRNCCECRPCPHGRLERNCALCSRTGHSEKHS